MTFARVEDALFERGTGLGLFAEACRDDDKGPDLFLGCEVFHVVGAELGSHDEDGQFGGGQLLHVVESLDALYLVFLRVDYAQRALVAAVLDVAHHGTARFVNIVRAADDDDAFRM